MVPTADRQRATVQVKVTILDRDPPDPARDGRARGFSRAGTAARRPQPVVAPTRASACRRRRFAPRAARHGRVARARRQARVARGRRRTGERRVSRDPPRALRRRELVARPAGVDSPAQRNARDSRANALPNHHSERPWHWSRSATSTSRSSARRRSIDVFTGLTLDIERGQLHSRSWGRPARGKSTLLNLIAGLDKPTAARCAWPAPR